MPNLGTYFRPDGPFGNPSDLLPQGKIKEAREAQEGAAEHATRDMLYISEKMYEVGCDGINFDTTAAAGDADFYATLNAVAEIKKAMPSLTVEVSNIPIHVNVGMGVGGVPAFETPPIDCVTRVSKAMVQIAKVDGL